MEQQSSDFYIYFDGLTLVSVEEGPEAAGLRPEARRLLLHQRPREQRLRHEREIGSNTWFFDNIVKPVRV